MTYMTNYNCTSGDVKPKHSNIREVQWWNFNPLIEIQSLHRLKCINSIVRLHYFIIEISIFNPLISLVHHWNFNDEIFIIELNCSVHHWNWHQDWNDEQFQKDIEIALFILDLRVWWKCTAPEETLQCFTRWEKPWKVINNNLADSLLSYRIFFYKVW